MTSGSPQPRHLDLRIWFAQIQVTTPDGRGMALRDFIAAGVRWWDGLYAGDPRTSGQGIFPLRSEWGPSRPSRFFMLPITTSRAGHLAPSPSPSRAATAPASPDTREPPICVLGGA